MGKIKRSLLALALSMSFLVHMGAVNDVGAYFYSGTCGSNNVVWIDGTDGHQYFLYRIYSWPLGPDTIHGYDGEKVNPAGGRSPVSNWTCVVR